MVLRLNPLLCAQKITIWKKKRQYGSIFEYAGEGFNQLD